MTVLFCAIMLRIGWKARVPDQLLSFVDVLLILGLSIGGIWVLGIFILILMAVARAGNRQLSRLSNL